MRQEIEQIQLIDKFLRGELSGTQLDAFKNKLRNDDIFALEVNAQSSIIEGIKLARREQLLLLLNGGKISEPIIENKTPKEIPLEKKEAVDEIFIPIDKPSEENRLVEHPRVYPIESILKNEFIENSIPKLKSNFNNWYFAAAAVLLAIFIYYYIFGYYIPHQRLVIANEDSLAALENTPESAVQKQENPEIKPESMLHATDSSSMDSLIINKPSRDNTDSLLHSNDKKLSKTQVSISSFETNKSDPQNTDQNNATDGKSKALTKLSNNTLDIENWHSASNFTGYKLRGSTLQIFDMAPEESLNLKYLDQKLFMKKNGNYYKLRNSGHFESYQKETNSDLIKLLDSL